MTMALFEPDSIRRITRAEYHILAETGAFEDERVELLDGVIVRTSPQGNPHGTVIVRLIEHFAPFAREVELRPQLPLEVDDYSEPEPDFAVCARRPDFDERAPRTAGLVIEVADSSRRRDLAQKPSIYARAGVTEYWVIDLKRRVLHQHLNPTADGFELVRIVHPPEVLRPVAFPMMGIALEEILPRG